MFRVAWKMLVSDRAKCAGMLFGVTFTSFLITFAASFFCGFMTRGFALIAENPEIDVWVMDPAVESPELTTRIPEWALSRVASVEGVGFATPLVLGSVDGRFANGRFQSFDVIGVDDATLSGLPPLMDGAVPAMLRSADAVVIDPGGTEGKLETPIAAADQWIMGLPHLDARTRSIREGDELLVGDRRVRVVARSQALPRFPPRPLLYTTLATATTILPQERRRFTFVGVSAAPGVDVGQLAERIAAATGLRARTSDQFESDTVRWYLVNSEDVGDVGAMLSLAISVGFGMTAVMLYMFTADSLKQYAVLVAMGTTPRLLLAMVLVQAGACAMLGTGMGVGLCGIVGRIASAGGFPFRMMWFTPLAGGLAVLLISAVAAAISVRPVLTLQPADVFAR